uniref:hypothetical protein n=1 Tax=Cyanothece sp. BG0011 TaxID=2082950 RepID=UPI001E498E98
KSRKSLSKSDRDHTNPPYSSTFGIEFDIPYWHRNFQLKIWEYTGNNQNTIHQKLDDLLGYPQP